MLLLEQLLSNLSVEVEPFAICEVETDRVLPLQAIDRVALHFVLAGQGTITVGRQTRNLKRYQLALVQRGRRQVLTGKRGADPTSHLDVPEHVGIEQLVAGDPSSAAIVAACGHLSARYARGMDLFRLMPDLLIIDFSSNAHMKAAFDQILEESGRSQPGSTAMLRALMTGCLVEIFRALCEHDRCHLPWLEALEDERMVRVVDEILSHPERNFSVDHLADLAAMSRSSFASTFASVFGRTPMAFVRETRLRRAAELLTSSEFGIGAIANRVGYESRTHFSTAFKDHFGASPSQFRDFPPSARRQLEARAS